MCNYIINREKGLGIKYLADLKDQVNANLPKLNVVLRDITFAGKSRRGKNAEQPLERNASALCNRAEKNST